MTTTQTYVQRPSLIEYAHVAELVVTTIVSMLILGFYLAHLQQHTGFFTPAFKGPLVGLFFASILYPIFTSLTKLFTRSKLTPAIVEWVGAVLFVTVAYWFFSVFPLEFAHVADVVPSAYRFIFSFFTSNDVGRIMVALVLLAGVIAVLVNSFKLVWRVSVSFFRTVTTSF